MDNLQHFQRIGTFCDKCCQVVCRCKQEEFPRARVVSSPIIKDILDEVEAQRHNDKINFAIEQVERERQSKSGKLLGVDVIQELKNQLK